jgi:hypothetical protein
VAGKTRPGEGDLAEEARAATLEAILCAARALAVENRLPEPASGEDALRPPLAFLWKEQVEKIRAFSADSAAGWQPAVLAVEMSLAR